MGLCVGQLFGREIVKIVVACLNFIVGWSLLTLIL